MITIKSDDEIKIMREAGRIVGQTLQKLVEASKPGVVAKDLDKLVRKEYKRIGCIPTFLGYAQPPYPATLCFSVNDELVHGIPDKQVIREGDIDQHRPRGDLQGLRRRQRRDVRGRREPTEEQQKLIDVTRESLWRGHSRRAGRRASSASSRMPSARTSRAWLRRRAAVRRSRRGSPDARGAAGAELRPGGPGVVLRKGMVLALEPMVTVGDYHTKVLDDEWTVSTVDGSLCAHFEHTIAITDGEPEVLTLP